MAKAFIMCKQCHHYVCTYSWFSFDSCIIILISIISILMVFLCVKDYKFSMNIQNRQIFPTSRSWFIFKTLVDLPETLRHFWHLTQLNALKKLFQSSFSLETEVWPSLASTRQAAMVDPLASVFPSPPSPEQLVNQWKLTTWLEFCIPALTWAI